jgi:hypothetical protein
MTYVFDGLTSSILRWKGCWVGVAADTETVDELCVSVSNVRAMGPSCRAYHGEARRSRPHPTSISKENVAARPRVEFALCGAAQSLLAGGGSS